MNTEELRDSIGFFESIDLYNIKVLISEQPEGPVKKALRFLDGMMYADALPGVLAHRIVDMMRLDNEDTRQDLEWVLERALKHLSVEDLNNHLVGTEILEEDWDIPLPDENVTEIK